MSAGVLERTGFPDDDGETFTADGVPDTDMSVDDLDVGQGIEKLEAHLKAAAPTAESTEEIPTYDPHSRRLMEAAGVMGFRRRRLISGASQSAMRYAGVAGALGVGRRY